MLYFVKASDEGPDIYIYIYIDSKNIHIEAVWQTLQIVPSKHFH